MIQGINKVKKVGGKAFLISTDFKKAFDLLNHDFILKTLKFFNFGENFCKIIQTMLTGRKGFIMLEDGLCPFFNFYSGSGQGDPPSPLLFNICIEILLLKIELSQNIEDAYDKQVMNRS